MISALRWHILELASAADEHQHRLTLSTNRRRARRLLRQKYDPVRDLPEAEFVKTFRLHKATVVLLVEELTPYMPRQRRNDGLSVMTKVLISLAFYATGSYQTLVGQSAFHNVSQKSVSRSVSEVTEALNRIYRHHIIWPLQRTDRNKIKAKFYQKFGIPGVLGCVDGTHVALLRPHLHEERYFNRKGYHSLNIMIVCDSELNILCVDASNPGSAHDSTVWQNHSLCTHLSGLADSGEQAFLLGDSGYPLRRTMMIPILDTVEGTPDHHYYMKHVIARNTIERCIGVLKARFRCLLVARALHYRPYTVGRIVNACCVLHNIANCTSAPVPLLSSEEADLENLHQEQEENLRAEAESRVIQSANNPRNRRVSPELLAGRALRQALVDKLWRDRM